jgi:DtxR family Mn-dependent transcriptional regulator
MLKKLSDKELITYQRYKGASLTEEGQRLSTNLVRKHRLWEVFLVQSLEMTWDEVHEIAEELEHIHSPRLIEKLDAFLGFPKFDPHGDPIPNAQGKYTLRTQIPLTDLKEGQEGILVGVKEDDPSFLKNLSEKGLTLGKELKVLTHDSYDHTLSIVVNGLKMNLSGPVARNIMIKLI